jgi:paraquat-inducible protein A
MQCFANYVSAPCDGFLAFFQWPARVTLHQGSTSTHSECVSAQPDRSDLRACHCCGLVHIVPAVKSGQSACCTRCGTNLIPYRSILKSGSRTTAAATAAFVLFWPAILCPILVVEKLGIRRETSLLEGIFELFRDAHWVMGMIVLLFSIVLPLTKLVLLVELSLFRRFNRRIQTRTLRLTEHLGRWSMLDVLLLSLLVMLVKLGDLVQFQFGPAITAFVLCVVMSLTASFCFDPRAIWEE